MSSEAASRLVAAVRWSGVNIKTLERLSPSGFFTYFIEKEGGVATAEHFARECPMVMEVLGIDLEYLEKGLPNFREVEYLHPLIQLAPHMTAEQIEDHLRLYVSRRAREARLKS